MSHEERNTSRDRLIGNKKRNTSRGHSMGNK